MLYGVGLPPRQLAPERSVVYLAHAAGANTIWVEFSAE